MSTSTAEAKLELAKVLSDNEDYILSLTKSKAVDLSEKMFQSVLISNSMMDQFSSLDHSRVKPQLQLRFLFRLMVQRIKQDESEGHKFLSLLESFGERPLYDYLQRSSSRETQPEGITYPDHNLGSDDISWILEVLIDANDKWEMLAIALPLPTHQRRNITGDNNIGKLTKVLDVWLSGESTPTVNKLTDALRSKLVGQGKLALKFEEQFKAIKCAHKGGCAKRYDTSNSIIVHQSPREVKVEDDKSTLLLVQANHRDNVSYQWNRNGKPIANNLSCESGQPSFSGVHDNLLFINHAHQGTEGEYTCCLRYEEGEVVSNKVTLTVLYSPEKKVLLDLYSSVNTQAPLDEAWPPVGAEAFINLVLIEPSDQAMDVDRNIDTMLDKRKEIEYDFIFGAYKSASLVLLEGRPGSGKTTLVCKLIKDWAEGMVLVQAKLVFLVSLRTLNNDRSQTNTLSEILQQFYSSSANLEAVISGLERNNGKGACFVFDGLDEYHPDREDNSVVFRILRRRYLSQAMIIVSSRPGALARLRRQVITQRIEVLGFTEDQISEYIEKFSFDVPLNSSFGPSHLNKYLSLHPNVLQMCYLPIHAAIICFVYKMKGGHLPHTQTKIYEEFTRSMILRHLKRNNLEIQLLSLKELPGDAHEYFNKLCRLAFDMTVELKQVINASEVSFPLSKDLGLYEDCSLGLITCNRTAQLSGVSTAYMFLHLTLQEYLAAYYIANAERERKCLLIQRLKSESRSIFQNVWTFFFGLETFESHESLKIYYEILTESSFTNFRYAFESQQQIVCDEVVRLCHGKITTTYMVKPSDVPLLVFIICNATQLIRELTIRFLYKSEFLMFFEQIKQVKLSELERLTIHYIVSRTSVFQHLSVILRSCKHLRFLALRFNGLTDEEGEYLANGITYLKNLVHLELGSCFVMTCVQTPGLPIVVNQIQYLIQVKILDLSSWKMDLNCCEVLASNICHLIELEQLFLRRNDINPDGAVILVSVFHHLTKLEILDLRRNNFSSDGAISLASSLHQFTKLKRLDFSGNRIGSSGAISLTSELQHLTNLELLNLDYNNIGSDGATNLATGLHHLTKLEYLFLSENGIDTPSAIKVISALKDCQKVRCVTLNKNTNFLNKGFNLRGLVSSDESATIDSLVTAVRLHKRNIDHCLGFTTINIQHNEQLSDSHTISECSNT